MFQLLVLGAVGTLACLVFVLLRRSEDRGHLLADTVGADDFHVVTGLRYLGGHPDALDAVARVNLAVGHELAAVVRSGTHLVSVPRSDVASLSVCAATDHVSPESVIDLRDDHDRSIVVSLLLEDGLSLDFERPDSLLSTMLAETAELRSALLQPATSPS